METDRHFPQDLGRVITAKRTTTVFLALALSLPVGNVQAAIERTADELYAQHCAICHLPGIAGAVRVDDRQLAAAVRNVLAGTKGVDLANTKIEVANGVVSMIGIVEEPVTATQAHDGVKRIPGVQRIDNRLVSGHQMGWD